MFVRLILLVAIAALGYSLYKKLQQKTNQEKPAAKPEDKTLAMKRCAKCGVHLPVNESIQYQTLHFCCDDHKKAYLQDHESGDGS
ncbi:MAG: hypothetical protein MI976_23240 [Pseudomonadales bacterium]|nr:hypothetical protein [Pseudomonadales bacterium]